MKHLAPLLLIVAACGGKAATTTPGNTGGAASGPPYAALFEQGKTWTWTRWCGWKVGLRATPAPCW